MRRKHLALLSIVIAGALVALTAAAWAYDRARANTIADGIVIGGVDVGGLDRAAARSKLRSELLEPLRAPVVLTRGTRSWRLTAREARTSVDIDGSVDAALARSRRGTFLARALDGALGRTLDQRLDPEASYSEAALRRVVGRVRRGIERSPRDASLTFTARSVSPVPSRAGLRVRVDRLRREMRAVLLSPTASREITVLVKSVRPNVTTAQLAAKYPTLIIVDRGRYRLTLYKALEPVKTYRIAVGRIGLETPAGLYTIQNMAIDPSWHVPKSDWAGDLAGKVIPPGPDNPIKARWMGIYDGAGIHGTSDIGSLGSAASHGCVRMSVPDVEDLYGRVSVGTPVYIA